MIDKLKKKPTESQLEKMESLWENHLHFYRSPLSEDITYNGYIYNLISHNIAYTYEQQFDVDVRFKYENNSLTPTGVTIEEKGSDVSRSENGSYSQRTRKTPSVVDEDKIPSAIFLKSKQNRRRSELHDRYVTKIGRRWIQYLESEGALREQLEVIKQDYLFPVTYEYTVYSTKPSENFNSTNIIGVKIENKVFLVDGWPFEFMDSNVLDTYCKKKTERSELPQPDENVINELGSLWQTYMISTLSRREAFQAALDYEYQFDVDTKFLYPKDRSHWAGGPIAVEINGKNFTADFASEFNDAILEETDPNWVTPYSFYTKARDETQKLTKDIIYEYGMLYIDFLDENKNRKRKEQLRNKKSYLEKAYSIHEIELKPYYHTTRVEGIIVEDIMFLSSGASDYYIQSYCDEECSVNEVIRSDGSQLGKFSSDKLIGNMVFVRARPNFEPNDNFEIKGRSLLSYRGNEENVIIPDGIRIIEKDAFKGCKSISNIEIPDSVEVIKKDSFLGCVNLTAVRIPKGVKEIDNHAFNQCDSLMEITVDSENPIFDSRDKCNAIIVTKRNQLFLGCANTVIPESIREIKEDAFYNCDNLTTIDIPKNVESIDHRSFVACGNLDVIRVHPDNRFYDSRENCNAIIETKYNELLIACNTTVIPDTIISIHRGAFPYNCRRSSITIPKNVVRIGRNTFAPMLYLKEIIVDPENPVYDSREHCNALIETASNKLIDGCATSTIPKSISEIGKTAFERCIGLESICIPGNVKRIGELAFAACKGLKSVEIENGTEIIEDSVFSYCNNLISAMLPESITEFGSGIFYDCENLTSVTLSNDISEIKMSSFYDCKNLKSVTLPENLKVIGETAFAGCKNLHSLSFPKHLEQIDVHAFWGCENLESVYFPESLQYIGYGAFAGCTGIKDLQLPHGPIHISGMAFGGCENIESINIPRYIDDVFNIFTGCHKLKKIVVDSENILYDSRNDCNAVIETSTNELVIGCVATVIPDSVRSIGISAFERCDSLKSIEIPEGVTVINALAFRKCQNLESVIIPESVTQIKEAAFAFCTKLSSVTIKNKNCRISDDAFHMCKFQIE
jgi:hypothetical protein